MPTVADIVVFLGGLLPRKPIEELYTVLGRAKRARPSATAICSVIFPCMRMSAWFAPTANVAWSWQCSRRATTRWYSR
ncbi:isocitrate dehydrogenase kinase/phosphatase AceK regulatory subunit [Dokdonella sp.]|uniref:isocitrate dehydrogenase kinase/phosphatase AceK regulatory subunit n=1 Tax=Dokdonella sp. TaxID=2291710 RepID=UPI003528AF02